MCVVSFDWEENDSVEKVKQYKKHGKTVWAVVEVTKACNLNCKWCYASSGNNSNFRQHMGMDRLKELLYLLKRNRVKQITYSGGEPTVYPHIKEAVKEAKDMGFVVHMNTNGYVLNRKFAKDLANSGLTQVQINIDSLDSKKHDRIRGRRNSFEKAVQALKNAKACGITGVSQTVVTRETENDLFDIFRFARNMGVGRSRVWDITPSGTAVAKMKLIPTDYVKTLEKLANFAYRNGARRVESGDPLFPNGFETKMEVAGGFCTAIRGAFMTIAYNGYVYPCVTQRVPLYNIFKIGKSELFEYHISKIKEYSESLRTPGICASCESFERCMGGCMTRRRFNEGRDYNCSQLNGKFN